MDIPYILFVEDFPRTHEDNDSILKALLLKHRSSIEKLAKDRRAPITQTYCKVVLEYYEENREKFEHIIPKEFKYADALDKAIKTGDYAEYCELKKNGGTELEQNCVALDAEDPERKQRILKNQIQIEWELMFVSKLERGTLPPLTKDPDEDPDDKQ